MMSDYKPTLNLPQTDFPMKADLSKREPNVLAFWEEKQIYQKRQQLRQGQEKFILHDGPPYANGHLHIGHALGKILKDIVMKSKALEGFDTPFVPGWDCHGLPIELNVERQLEQKKQRVNPDEFRRLCRDYAQSQIEIQRQEFKRLGVFGDWEHPYATMDYLFEADTVRALGQMIANGHLQRGSKPVHWCVECGSALAEAEVEYQDKASLAVDVLFRMVDDQSLKDRFSLQSIKTQPVSVVIWTTTPWTLPANQAVALHPHIEYALIEVSASHLSEQYLVVAAGLVENLMQRWEIEDYHIVATCQGEILEHLTVQHPFLPRQVPIILGNHVTVDAGTGAVHTAPAHGQEDYVVASRYDLAILNPVNDQGCFIPDTPFFAGEHVFKANEHVVDVLKERGALLKVEKITHSYPHCWRHKIPLIFRATPQWFISMDKKALRAHSLSAIEQVEWFPDWGEARMASMVTQRPDWCISRQRLWGTPIPLFIHRETESLHPQTQSLIEQVAQRIEQKGIEAWYELEPAELLGEEAKHYKKVSDTLDVWFDSGVSHYCVLTRRPELRWPADIYLEGADQYRGWFQSSLLTACATVGSAPYRRVLSYGFTVDAQGRKMSKSLGNVLPPEKIWNSLGAEMIRLWAAATDYRGEASFSDEIFKRCSETYRRIRNTMRFLLANLFDFDPKNDQLSFDSLLNLDQWAVDCAYRTQEDIRLGYDRLQFHVVLQKIQQFCSLDMGSFYLDVIKDRQYTTQKNSHARRSAQTAMYHILEALVRWLNPILSFTAEEVWQHIPWREQESVFFTTWYEGLVQLPEQTPFNAAFWQQIIQVREAVNGQLEKARHEGMIGSGLEAHVHLYVDEVLYQSLQKMRDELRFIFITSGASIHHHSTLTDTLVEQNAPGLWIKIQTAEGEKCVRCWHRLPSVGQNPEHPQLCARCVDNVAGAGEQRLYA